MKACWTLSLVSIVLLSGASSVLAQGGSQNLGMAHRATQQLNPAIKENLIPDFGYVVYGSDGTVLKAFGPGTPVEQLPTGDLQVLGAQFPPGAVVRTEDGPTYVDALAKVEQPDAVDSDYTKTLKDVVNSISEGAEYVATNLCPHAARPSNIKVEIVGGFNFYVHGSVTSTVDWNLEEICEDNDGAMNSATQPFSPQ